MGAEVIGFGFQIKLENLYSSGAGQVQSSHIVEILRILGPEFYKKKSVKCSCALPSLPQKHHFLL